MKVWVKILFFYIKYCNKTCQIKGKWVEYLGKIKNRSAAKLGEANRSEAKLDEVNYFICKALSQIKILIYEKINYSFCEFSRILPESWRELGE